MFISIIQLAFLHIFWPGKAMLSYQKINPYQNIYEKKKKKPEKCEVPPATTLQKRPVKITMYLGLDIIIKLKFTTDVDRFVILNVLNYLTKNFES